MGSIKRLRIQGCVVRTQIPMLGRPSLWTTELSAAGPSGIAVSQRPPDLSPSVLNTPVGHLFLCSLSLVPLPTFPIGTVIVTPFISGFVGRVEGSREPQYWGIAYPLLHTVLYPEPGEEAGSPPPDLPGMVGAWFQAHLRHSPSACLACCRLKPSARSVLGTSS
jgi:hypothetical protein